MKKYLALLLLPISIACNGADKDIEMVKAYVTQTKLETNEICSDLLWYEFDSTYTNDGQLELVKLGILKKVDSKNPSKTKVALNEGASAYLERGFGDDNFSICATGKPIKTIEKIERVGTNNVIKVSLKVDNSKVSKWFLDKSLEKTKLKNMQKQFIEDEVLYFEVVNGIVWKRYSE
ncbi:hypothetical protein [Taylorella equigenitalis]|uniref:Lipoprotein n=2 Tax=Taylorella equigenitalis TaxID=29575 RepID=A0A654KFA8_TAYEM|nr:hypothetical protein [Taylorella equigenitalis]ADU91090.1 hypothetical protein TEQUI_0134 [Taylorella equigenitalis MCE9]AFN36194.1 putative lipoprotein [Taylorella equigenitalis ATCC 35865]ASY39599.1 hypothetical protein CA604_05665 [Taylorella equigenitalis]ASY42539.1 hypothetical protein CA943_05420 [Taylorella equigenitalis]KGK34108.1 hypothetical protein LW90_00660 [Taylorella equigenitalis]